MMDIFFFFFFSWAIDDGYTLALVAIICTFLILGHWHWRRHNKNSPITNWPLVGMLPGLVCNAPPRIHDYFTEVLRKCGLTLDFKGPRFTNLNFIMTSDPENLHYILSTNFGNFQKGSAFKKIFEDLGDGLIIAESDSWKAQRKLIHSLFKDTKFQLLLEKTIEHMVEKDLFPILDQVLQRGTEVDMQDLLLRFTFDVICIVLLGFNSNYLSIELPNNLVATAIDEFEDTLFRRHIVPQSIWKLQKWLQIGEERKATSAHKTIGDFIYHHISLKRELIKGTSPGKEAEMEESLYDSLLTRFIKEEEKESIGAFKISDGFLRDSVVNLLVAARNTSSAALSWFFWLVATNPSVEHKIREEIKAHFHLKEGEKSSFFSFEKLNKLVYLHAVLCETLRLYPPVPFNHRAAVQPDILPNGHRLDKGSEIMFCHYAMGRMKEIWGEDCEEFKPQRWISKQGEILHFPSYKFVAFSAGPRYCVGKDMAFMQMKIVATSVIWNYHLQVVEGHPISPSDSIVLRMKHGLKVNVMKTYQ